MMTDKLLTIIKSLLAIGVSLGLFTMTGEEGNKLAIDLVAGGNAGYAIITMIRAFLFK